MGSCILTPCTTLNSKQLAKNEINNKMVTGGTVPRELADTRHNKQTKLNTMQHCNEQQNAVLASIAQFAAQGPHMLATKMLSLLFLLLLLLLTRRARFTELTLSLLLLLLFLLVPCLSACPFNFHTGHELFPLTFWHFLQSFLHDFFLIVLQLLDVCHVLHKTMLCQQAGMCISSQTQEQRGT